MSLKSRVLSWTPQSLRPYWAKLEASPLSYRLARGFFWSLAGTSLSRALSLLSSIIIARILGKVGVGEIGVIQSTVGIFGAFAGLGMGLTATKYVSQYKQSDPSKAGAIIGLSSSISWLSGSLITVAMIILAPWFARHTLAAPHLEGLIRIGSLLLLFGAVNGAQTGALAGFEAFKSIATVNLLAGILTFPLMVGGVYCLGLAGAVWGLVVSLAVGCLLNYIALCREAARAGVKFSRSISKPDWSVLFHFSLPSMLSSLALGPLTWACNALLVNRTDGYAEMGVYNAANNWFNAITFLPTVLGQVILPLLSGCAGQGDNTSSRRVVGIAIKANAVVVVPVVLIGSLMSPLIMGAYGPGFKHGWPTMVVVMISAGLVAIQSPVGQWIVASAKMWTTFFMYLGWSLTFLLVTWALVGWGSLGLATARLVAYILNGVCIFWFAFSCLLKQESHKAPSAGGQGASNSEQA